MNEITTTIKGIIENRLRGVFTSFVAEIVTFSGLEATIKPLLQRGSGLTATNYPNIEKVPCLYTLSGGIIVRPKYTAGDYVLCICTQAGGMLFRQRVSIGQSLLDLANAMVLCGVPAVGIEIPETAKNLDGLVAVGNKIFQFDGDNIFLKDVTGTTLMQTDGSDVISITPAGRVSLLNHVHPTSWGPTLPPQKT